jgi:hypothetical protein
MRFSCEFKTLRGESEAMTAMERRQDQQVWRTGAIGERGLLDQHQMGVGGDAGPTPNLQDLRELTLGGEGLKLTRRREVC